MGHFVHDTGRGGAGGGGQQFWLCCHVYMWLFVQFTWDGRQLLQLDASTPWMFQTFCWCSSLIMFVSWSAQEVYHGVTSMFYPGCSYYLSAEVDFLPTWPVEVMPAGTWLQLLQLPNTITTQIQTTSCTHGRPHRPVGWFLSECDSTSSRHSSPWRLLYSNMSLSIERFLNSHLVLLWWERSELMVQHEGFVFMEQIQVGPELTDVWAYLFAYVHLGLTSSGVSDEHLERKKRLVR